MGDICDDNRFEVIAEAKKDLLESTNIEMSPDEMSVIDNILFRCWQMGWLRQYETYEFCASGENPCKEYDQERHCCHRWTKVIRQTIEEMKEEPDRKKGKWLNLDALISEQNEIMKKNLDKKGKDPEACLRFGMARSIKTYLLRKYAEQNNTEFCGNWETGIDGKERCSICWTPKKYSDLNGECVICGADMRGE